jgi:CDP-glucose 4,6-dehydratase
MASFFEGKRALVTGATGFIGSWLTRSLVDDGASVTAFAADWPGDSELVRSGVAGRVEAIEGRLEDYGAIEAAITSNRIDTVFHLGAQTQVGVANADPLPTFESNIRGSYNLLEVCRRHADTVLRVVIASSDKAYGDTGELPYRESHPLQGRYPYDVSKSCTDLIAQSYWHTYAMPLAIARCGNVYGGGDLNWDRVVPGTIRSLVAGEAPVIRSDGLFTRDYVFVDDVVDAYKLLASSLDGMPQIRGDGFNFGPDEAISVLTMVREISVLMGKGDVDPVIARTAQAEILHQHLSSERAQEVLGWSPTRPMAFGLERAIEWYRDFLTD